MTLREIGEKTGISNEGSVASRIRELRVHGWEIQHDQWATVHFYTFRGFNQSLET